MPVGEGELLEVGKAEHPEAPQQGRILLRCPRADVLPDLGGQSVHGPRPVQAPEVLQRVEVAELPRHCHMALHSMQQAELILDSRQAGPQRLSGAISMDMDCARRHCSHGMRSGHASTGGAGFGMPSSVWSIGCKPVAAILTALGKVQAGRYGIALRAPVGVGC